MTTTIYCLACDDVVWYVGRTRHPYNREHHHKGKYASYGSSLIPDGVKWSFIILEAVETEYAIDAEKFYYDYLQPRVNKHVPGRSHYESKAAWKAAYPEKVIESNRIQYLKRKAKNANLV